MRRADDIRLVHALPGRVRLRVGSLKGSPRDASAVRERLSGIPGIDRVEASPLTGTVLIEYDPELSESFDFYASVANAFGVSLAECSPDILSLLEGAHRNGASSRTRSAFLGSEQMRLLVPLALFALGVRSLLVSEKLTFPAWHDYFWFAFGSFFMLNRDTPTRA